MELSQTNLLKSSNQIFAAEIENVVVEDRVVAIGNAVIPTTSLGVKEQFQELAEGVG